MDYDKIIFVTTDDTSVGPMAAAIYKGIVEEPPVPVISKGLVVLFSEPVNPKAMDVLKNNNVAQMKETSSQLEAGDITKRTIVFASGVREKEAVLKNYEGCVDPENVFTFGEGAGELTDIEDPYGTDIIGYERCYFELVRIVKKIVYRLENNMIG